MEKVCFVIMGFGTKTDFRTGREIDLDKTYNTIIEPVFKQLGFICLRADDIKHSGVIDLHMYENILKSDFVLADISTLNPNVLYELGIRHAVKRYSTLIIAEKELEYPFDLNHILIDSYEHLGKAIDYDEVIRFRKLLSDKIEQILKNPVVDSPFYTILPNLQTPSFTKEEIEEIKETISVGKSVSEILVESEEARKKNDFEKAIELLNEARSLLPRNDFIIQKLSLATYKSKLPSVGTALFNAEIILSILKPEKTTDPETLGLSGAINKRLFEEYSDIKYLERSLWFYSRGFYIKQDYYNGINTAFLYTLKSSLDEDQFQAYANFGQGIEIRKKVIELCQQIISEVNFKLREDKEWIYLTIAEAFFGIGDEKKENEFLNLAKEIQQGEFALNSYYEQRDKIEKSITLFNNKWNSK